MTMNICCSKIEAFEYWTKAAELEDVEVHFRLSDLYRFGEGVEKDMEKVINHLEAATIGGHPNARYDLGCMEWNWNNNKAERAVKHWVIGARRHDDSIKGLMYAYKRGFVSKVNLTAALREYQAAVDATKTKSPQREAARMCGVF